MNFKTTYTAALLGLGALVASCQSDYLDEAPRTGIDDESIKYTENGAEAAVTALARQMQVQMEGCKNGNLNASGETFFANLYGEGLGCDANIGEITNYANSSCNPDNMRAPSGWWGAWMYRYGYSIVTPANLILDALPEGELKPQQYWLKACALTMRAHAYFRMMQVFGPRWADSDNGNAYALVFRLHGNEPNEHPLNTCNEIYDRLYADLYEALECFGKSDKERGDDLFYPAPEVTKGIFARLALLKNDYGTARKMAHEARQGYPIMTPDQYLGGFSINMSETIWGPAMDPLGIYYWNFGTHYACNGHYTNSWGYSDSMDYSLYRHLTLTDVRAKLYFGPLTCELAPELAAKYKIDPADFFSEDVYKQTKLGVTITSTGDPTGKNLDMWKFIKAYGKTLAPLRPEDIKGIYPSNKKGISMGVQYKFQGLPDGYTSCWVPYMRSAEMLLIEAECASMMGDDTVAKECLLELMAKRDTEYAFDGAGEELLAEIKLQRRLELWGEGFCWFDFKRWGETMTRRAWDPADMEECGGWPNTLAREFTPDYMHGWRVAIPQREFDLNKLADPSLLGL